MGSDRIGGFGAVRKRPWESTLIVLMVLSAALLLAFRSDFGFFLDDWSLVIGKEDPTDWLLPHNEHIVLLPAAIFKLSLALFGMTPMPIHGLAVGLFLTGVGLLFYWLRPLVGEAAAVLFCAPVLFLGSATEDLIWAFQIGFFGSVAAGLAALLCLRKGTGRADAWACLLLVVSLLFSSFGVPFGVAAAVQLLFRDGRSEPGNLLRRSWVFLVPGLVYVAWWLGWGHLAPSQISVENVVETPLYALSAFAYGASAITGAFPLKETGESFVWALPGLLMLSLIGYLLYRRRRVPDQLIVALAAGFSFWILSGLNYVPGRDFTTSRYQYPAAIFIAMILGGALAGWRPDTRTLRLVGAAAAFAVAVNLAALFVSFRDTFKPVEQRGLAALTALEIARDTVAPETAVPMSESGEATVTAGPYFEATGKYGSPALEAEEIPGLSETNRTLLDRFLVEALPVSPIPPALVEPRRRGCRALRAGPTASETTGLTSRLLYLRPRESVEIRLGRFGSAAAAPGGKLEGNRPTGFVIPPDRSSRPWRIGFAGTGKVTVCPARAAK